MNELGRIGGDGALSFNGKQVRPFRVNAPELHGEITHSNTSLFGLPVRFTCRVVNQNVGFGPEFDHWVWH